MKLPERALLSVDEGVVGALLRLALGFAVAPVWTIARREHGTGWSLVLFFVIVLLTLRVAPAVLRKLVPFSGSLQTVWAERRQIAKRFDSYQWQKLFWIGLGLALYAVQSGRPSRALLTLTAACVSSGAIGLAVWRSRSAERVQHAG